jgi:DNA modification methylase
MVDDQDTQRIELRLGDCVEVLQGLPEGSIGAIVADPPYGLEFMGKDFDTFRHIRRDFEALPDEWVQEYLESPGGD